MRNELFLFQHIQQYTDRTSRGDILRWIKSDRKTAVHIWHTFAGIKQHLHTINLANFVFGKIHFSKFYVYLLVVALTSNGWEISVFLSWQMLLKDNAYGDNWTRSLFHKYYTVIFPASSSA